MTIASIPAMHAPDARRARAATRPRKARRTMPYRIMQLSYYPAVVSAGLILGAGGAVVQVSHEVMASQAAPIRAAYGEPGDGPVIVATPPAAPYAGTAVALAGTSMAVLAVVGKGVMDLIFGYKERQRNATEALIANLNEEIARLRRDGLETDRLHGDALGQVANLTRQVEQLLADNQQLIADNRQFRDMLREQGQDILKSVEHVNDNVKHRGEIGVKVAKAVVKQLGGSESDFDAATIPPGETPLPPERS